MPTIQPGTTSNIAIKIGEVVRTTGEGIASFSTPTGQLISLTTNNVIGPFDSARVVSVTAQSLISYAIDPLPHPRPVIIVSSDAPSNTDGQPDGIIYIQTAP